MFFRDYRSTAVSISDNGKWFLGIFIYPKNNFVILTDKKTRSAFFNSRAVFHDAVSNAGLASIMEGRSVADQITVLYPDGTFAIPEGLDFKKVSFAFFPNNDSILEVVFRDDSRRQFDAMCLSRSIQKAPHAKSCLALMLGFVLFTFFLILILCHTRA